MLRSQLFSCSKHKMFVLFALLLLCSLPLFASAEPDPDPCTDINGTWIGSFTPAREDTEKQYCTYEAKATGSTYKDRVRLVIEITKGRPNDTKSKCSDLLFAMEGLCHEGQLQFDFGVKGTVFGGYIHVRHGVEELLLQKTKT